MAKTIKVIDLLNKIANDFSYQPTVIYRGITYKHDGIDYRNNQNDKYGILAGWAINLILNDTVEIIEEQQDIDIQEIEEIKFRESDKEHLGFGVDLAHSKINELVQAVKQLDKNIKDKE